MQSAKKIIRLSSESKNTAYIKLPAWDYTQGKALCLWSLWLLAALYSTNILRWWIFLIWICVSDKVWKYLEWQYNQWREVGWQLLREARGTSRLEESPMPSGDNSTMSHFHNKILKYYKSFLWFLQWGGLSMQYIFTHTYLMHLV